MRKTLEQKRRAAKAREERLRKPSEEKSKNISSPIPVIAPRASRTTNKDKDEANEHPKENRKKDDENKSEKRKANSMSAVLSLVFIGVLFVVTFAFAFHYWQQKNYTIALRWSFLAYLFVGLGIAFALHYYVVEPREAANTDPIPPTPTDRAWLSVDVIPNGPFIYRGDTGNLSVRFTIKNTGRSVANEVEIHAKAFAVTWGDAIFTEPANQQKELCGSIEPKLTPIGITVFPDSPETIDFTFGITKQEMEAHRIENTNMVALVLVGCVDYLSSNHPSHHQTGFIYEIKFSDLKKDPAHPFTMRIGQEVPTDKLLLIKYFFGGDYAN